MDYLCNRLYIYTLFISMQVSSNGWPNSPSKDWYGRMKKKETTDWSRSQKNQRRHKAISTGDINGTIIVKLYYI